MMTILGTVVKDNKGHTCVRKADGRWTEVDSVNLDSSIAQKLEWEYGKLIGRPEQLRWQIGNILTSVRMLMGYSIEEASYKVADNKDRADSIHRNIQDRWNLLLDQLAEEGGHRHDVDWVLEKIEEEKNENLIKINQLIKNTKAITERTLTDYNLLRKQHEKILDTRSFILNLAKEYPSTEDSQLEAK